MFKCLLDTGWHIPYIGHQGGIVGSDSMLWIPYQEHATFTHHRKAGVSCLLVSPLKLTASGKPYPCSLPSHPDNCRSLYYSILHLYITEVWGNSLDWGGSDSIEKDSRSGAIASSAGNKYAEGCDMHGLMSQLPQAGRRTGKKKPALGTKKKCSYLIYHLTGSWNMVMKGRGGRATKKSWLISWLDNFSFPRNISGAEVN